jgi:hypothetical protein
MPNSLLLTDFDSVTDREHRESRDREHRQLKEKRRNKKETLEKQQGKKIKF